MNFNKIEFRVSNGSEEDFNLLRRIHKNAMFENVTQSIGCWDDELQKKRLEKHFKEAHSTLEFIIYEEQIVGTINSRIKKYEDGEYYFIEQLYFIPQYQGKGLGSHLINLKINKHENGLNTRLSVLKNDKKAHEFYFKNGFEEYFEDEYQKYMQRKSGLKLRNKI